MNKKKLMIGAVAATGLLAGGLAMAHSAGYGPGYGPGNCGGPQMQGQYGPGKRGPMGPGMQGQYGHGPRGPMGPGMHGQYGPGPRGPMDPGMQGQYGHGPMGPGMYGQRGPGWQSGPRFATLDAAQLNTLKTELGITADQDAAWTAYTKTVQDAATAMKTARTEFTGQLDKIRQERDTAQTKMRDEAKKQSDAVTTAAGGLLAKLTDAQKAKAQQALPGLAFGPGTHQAGGPGWHHHWR